MVISKYGLFKIKSWFYFRTVSVFKDNLNTTDLYSRFKQLIFNKQKPQKYNKQDNKPQRNEGICEQIS